LPMWTRHAVLLMTNERGGKGGVEWSGKRAKKKERRKIRMILHSSKMQLL
jgi:hypothetical protein